MSDTGIEFFITITYLAFIFSAAIFALRAGGIAGTALAKILMSKLDNKKYTEELDKIKIKADKRLKEDEWYIE